MPAPKPKKVTIRKHNGDDTLSWAVFVNGVIAHPSLTGLSRSQAKYYRDQVKSELGQPIAELKVVPNAE